MKLARANSISRMNPPIARKGERGFALLVVMLMAAAIAYSLYTQVPRFAFETMREREQVLMDRGNQYKRAIQVFYAVNKRYPARMEDLENTNDKRFLRRRYKDPLTGKDEWRLIHTNGSALTDSLVQKPPAQNAANGTPGTGTLPGGGPLGANNMNSFSALTPPTNTAPATNNGVPQPVAVNPAAQRRPSDRNTNFPVPTPTATPTQNLPQDPNYSAGLFSPGYNPNDPSTWPAITLAPVTPQNGAQGQQGQILQPGQSFLQPGQTLQQNQPVGIPGFAGQSALPGQPTTQITPLPFSQQDPNVQTSSPFAPQANAFGDQSNNPVQPFNAQQQANSLVQPNPFPVQTPSAIPGQGPGQGGFNPQPTQVYNPGLGFAGNPLAPDSQSANQANPAAVPGQNPGLDGINARLTNQGPAPVPPSPISGNVQNSQVAPGIAGVASTFEGTSIKTYNKRTKYKEWEFVFDPSTATMPGQTQNPAGLPGQVPASGQAQQGASGTFSLGANPFAPNTNPQAPNPQQPINAAPATSPFGQAPNPFGQAPNPFGAPTQ